MEQIKPLNGVKVVELSLMVAAATCGRMMADWGADVIKIENTKGGDTMRKWPAGVGAPVEEDFNPLFDSLNANKRAASINLKTPEGMNIMYKLLENADVFLTNVRTAGLEHMGLDYDTLKRKFPRLVVAQVLGYGEKGPDKDRPGYDNTAFWARGGFMYSQSIEGSDESYPVYMPTGFGDTICALGIMAATVSAIMAARTTGKGDRVSLSLYGTAMWMANILINNTQFGMHYPISRGLCSPLGAPFRCKDSRWFMPQVVDFDRDAHTYFSLLGADDMIDNPIYSDRANFNKKEVSEPVICRFEKIFAQKTASEWNKLFKSKDLCCEILCSYDETLNDEQAVVNDNVFTMHYDNGQEVKLVRPCLRSENLGTPDYNRGPMYGEHTASILTDIGCSKEEIDILIKEKIVIQHD
jgi:(R)-2-hydroxy-4-methylpentanoate CoA-transferase